MTTYYIRPNLSDFADTTGYSLSSGGSSAGAVPGQSDDVIFDGNSGPSRAIFNNLTCKSLNMTAGSITCDRSKAINLWGGNSSLSGAFGAVLLTYPYGASTQGTATLSAVPGTTVQRISLRGCWNWTLNSDLTVLADVYVTAYNSDTWGGCTFTVATGHTLYADSVSLVGDTSRQAYIAGGGTLEITGSVGVTYSSTDPTNSASTVYPVIYTGVSAFIAVSSLRFNNASNATKYLTFGSSISPISNLTLIGGLNGLGGFIFMNALDLTVTGTFDVSRASFVQFPANIFKAGTWNMSCPSGQTYLRGYGTTATYLWCSGVAQMQASNARFFKINVTGGTPANTLRALNCADSGSNVGITFVTLISRFLSFL